MSKLYGGDTVKQYVCRALFGHGRYRGHNEVVDVLHELQRRLDKVSVIGRTFVQLEPGYEPDTWNCSVILSHRYGQMVKITETRGTIPLAVYHCAAEYIRTNGVTT